MEVLFFSLIGGVVSLFAAILLINNRKTAELLAKFATPFAAGVLLAAAFTDLLPEALHEATSEPRSVLIWALLGMLAFFMLERFLRFFHHHHEHGKEKANNSLVIIGDTLHNALDGIAIGAAFLIDTPTGIVATLAVATHEIPQEIGDFGLLLKNGMKKSKVIIVNILSALATTATALITYALGGNDSFPVPALLAITAGFFIYIASSDIIPEIHESINKNKRDIRPWLLIFGAVFIMIASPIAHDYIDAGHNDEHSTVEHKDFIVEEGRLAPKISLGVEKSESGLTIHTITENFKFTPEKEGGEAILGEGHAHLYIDGVKVTRLYSEWAFVPTSLLPENYELVTVSLSNNDHSEYHLADDTPIQTTIDVNSCVNYMDKDGETMLYQECSTVAEPHSEHEDEHGH